MPSFLRIACLLAVAVLPLGAQPKGGYVIALRPDKDPQQQLAERKSLETVLAEKLGTAVSTQVPTANAVVIEGLANGTIDLAYLSATSMVQARDRGLASILLAGEIHGQTSYQSYWVCLKEKPYASIADLRGKPVAFASRTSTSGYVVPLWDLHTQGLVGDDADARSFFGRSNVLFGIGYVSAIERLFSGEAEAAAVSYYVLDEDKHLTAEQRARLRMLDQQGPVPTHVIAVRSSLPEADRARLREALLSLNSPEHAQLRDKVFTSKLVEVDEAAHLETIASALAFAAKAPVR